MRRRSPITKCVFCGSTNLNHEHVFSKWTHRFLAPRKPGRARSFVGTQFADRVIGQEIKLPGQVRDWQVKCVCGGRHHTCNNGWMREIENRARPVLIPLIEGDEHRLYPPQQKIIATWAILKAIVGEYGGRHVVNVHHKQRKYLKTHSLPPKNGWGVWIGSYYRANYRPEWVSRPFLLITKDVRSQVKDETATYYNSCASTQIVGKLFIHVVHSPMPDFIRRLHFHPPERGTLFRIWPDSETSIKWPSRALSDRDADSVSDGIATLLTEIKRKSGAPHA